MLESDFSFKVKRQKSSINKPLNLNVTRKN
jgi:hypothetical protein